MYLLEVIEELAYNLFVLFHFDALLILNMSYVIVHSALDCGTMKKFSVFLSIFKPSDS